MTCRTACQQGPHLPAILDQYRTQEIIGRLRSHLAEMGPESRIEVSRSEVEAILEVVDKGETVRWPREMK